MISIIVPVFNVAKYLENTILSIVNQVDFSDWELILIDDGSNDGSTDICDEYAQKDSRIKVHHKQNGGLSSARNAGIEISRGEFILFLDGDDCLDSHSLSALSNTINAHPDVDLIQFRYEEVHPASPLGHLVAQEIENYEELSSEEDFFERLYVLGGVAASACTKLIRRAILGDLRFREGIIHEDEQFTTHLLSRCHRVGYCSNEFYKYAMRNNSIQHSSFSLTRLDAISVLDDRISYLKSRAYTRLVQLFQYRLFCNLLLLWTSAYEAGNEEAIRIVELRLASLCNEKFAVNGLMHRIIYSNGVGLLRPMYIVRNTLKPLVQKIRNVKFKISDSKIKHKRRKQIKCKDFSIISNNCWGGLVYQYFGLRYNSPTVGLFIMDDDYIKFLERLDHYLQQPLRFIKIDESRYKEKLASESTAKNNYPIAILDDIEIHFLHYHSEEEAELKWNARKARINYDNLIIKMSQRSSNDCHILERFAALPYKNKICFTEFEYIGKEFVFVPELKYLNIQGGDETPFVMARLNLVEFLSTCS